jgi:hypothetical protein
MGTIWDKYYQNVIHKQDVFQSSAVSMYICIFDHYHIYRRGGEEGRRGRKEERRRGGEEEKRRGGEEERRGGEEERMITGYCVFVMWPGNRVGLVGVAC